MLVLESHGAEETEIREKLPQVGKGTLIFRSPQSSVLFATLPKDALLVPNFYSVCIQSRNPCFFSLLNHRLNTH